MQFWSPKCNLSVNYLDILLAVYELPVYLASYLLSSTQKMELIRRFPLKCQLLLNWQPFRVLLLSFIVLITLLFIESYVVTNTHKMEQANRIHNALNTITTSLISIFWKNVQIWTSRKVAKSHFILSKIPVFTCKKKECK
ncbi:unnamed protein product [Lactuca virosa]|uniref:Uncharacterized protein n=1 Tax=Lactuca virosa TaxID=75947 RepID=A0AAU9NET6_9ASTR|nr:unnamed protein product [Lactuca virosa]